MGFWEAIVSFFTAFSLLSWVMLLMGLSFAVIEMFRSSRRVLGASGSVLIVAGTAVRMLDGGTVFTLFLIVFFVCFVLFCAHLLVLRFQKSGWLYQSLHLALIEQKRGIETGEYEFLVGLSGTATTDIHADGNMQLGDVTLLVRSDRPIDRGSRVRVTAVDGEKVFVTEEELKPMEKGLRNSTDKSPRSIDKSLSRSKDKSPKSADKTRRSTDKTHQTNEKSRFKPNKGS